MPASIWTSDFTLLLFVIVLCTSVGVGIVVYKRFNGLKYCTKRLYRTTTTTLRSSTSNPILPSFGTSLDSPPYLSFGSDISSTSQVHGPHVFKMKEVSNSNIKPLPVTPSIPVLAGFGRSPTSPVRPDTGSYFGGSSTYSSSPPPSPNVSPTLLVQDVLPPNITMPISRRTALDRMMERWSQEAKKVGKDGRKHPKDGVPHSAYTPIAQISKESSRPPSIIVTQPSSKSLSAYQSAYAFMLVTGPDEDPFFWDTLPPPRDKVSVAGIIPTGTAPRRSNDANKENKATTAIVTPTGMKLPLSAHLSVPSRSGKHKSRTRRAVLGDSTKSRSVKLPTAAYTG